MRISGTKPSSVILSPKTNLKSGKVMPQKYRNKLKQKGMVL